MKKSAAMLSITCVVLATFVFAFRHMKERTKAIILSTSARADEYELMEQFSKQYELGEATNAIQLGKEVTALLDKPNSSNEERATLAVTHARLARLYKELGMDDRFSEECDKARDQMILLSPGLSMSSTDVVEHILDRHQIKRGESAHPKPQ